MIKELAVMKKASIDSLGGVERGNVFDQSVDVTHTLSIHDIRYEVDVKTRPCTRATRKTILKDMT